MKNTFQKAYFENIGQKGGAPKEWGVKIEYTDGSHDEYVLKENSGNYTLDDFSGNFNDKFEETGKLINNFLSSSSLNKSKITSAMKTKITKDTTQLNECLNKRVGLRNVRNTCYLNSALQCLIHTKKLTKYFLKTTNDMPVTKAYKTLLEQYCKASNKGSLDDKIMNNYVDVLKSINKSWKFHDQQDSQEFITDIFFKNLSEENNNTKKEIENIFSFETITTRNCYNKNVIIRKYSPSKATIFILNLLFKNNSSLNLNSLINSYLKQIMTPNDFNCENTETDKVVEENKFNTLPKILSIHLLRFINMGKNNTFTKKKLNNKVSFPLELSLKSVETGNEDVKFRLYAFINHCGRIDGGHYTSVIKTNDGWFEMNDSSVTPKNENEVLNNYQKNVYVLFYERI